MSIAETTLTFRLPEPLAERFKKSCEEAGTTQSPILRALMAGYCSGAVSVIAVGEVTTVPPAGKKQLPLPGTGSAKRSAKRAKKGAK
jgi:hypothetical protein